MAEKTISNLDRRPSESTTDTESYEPRQQEGGYAAWSTVMGSVLIYYAASGLMNSFGFFQDYYSKELLHHIPAPNIAFIGTLQMALCNIFASISGALCDRYGVKVSILHQPSADGELTKSQYLYIGSGTGMVVSLLILTYIPTSQFLLVLMTQGLMLGLSTAFAVQPALTVVGQHFKDKRALVMSLVCIGSSLGGIGFPLMFNKLVPRLGFANALRIACLKIALCYSIALFLSTSKHSNNPERKSRTPLIDFGGFRDFRYAVLCVGMWFTILGLWIPAYYIKTYTAAAYGNNDISQYFLCIINGCSIVGAIFAGTMGDRIGRLNLLWPMVLMSGCLCLFLWLLSTSMPTLVLFISMYGFFSSSVSALPASIIGQITPDDKLGARTGAFFSLISAASLGGTPIAGALISDANSRDGYRWLILFSGTALVLGSVFMLASRLLHTQDLRKKW
ncbi:MFS-1 multi-domain protein [Pyrenophora tritici-repentis]|uniref:MFS-1 multi-domain protein n=2 Tax=Pyrenophora tritici-repentis TaxID=45151 RepID=A0A2W1HFT4_9PLEO|nr:uncharacterized protein PTRG_07116 [Pyrenophora tritici-repentis Pt-1C-BFP]KAA8614678.1 MFS-1 multi-domain protein [Pyrenophora tritici-repentis]EDU50035.1 conserved hypothetical protein [Pyrenophora tritici-repentis Pt-1C-BFP]KAF7444507.1 MFS-1 multi-domain protein [Pyrenophora tritici-repentis]KAF7564839.1 MFS-1 multi-domain protein [Pyrenophora tritici-repentis]KAG9378747.1 MFS-1 multi-domain protein [Pyrenophora tritici-repentis]